MMSSIPLSAPHVAHRVIAGLAASALLVLGVVTWSGCEKTSSAAGSPAAASGAAPSGARAGRGGAGGDIPVVTARAIEKSLPVTAQTVGNVEALSTVEVHAQVAGELTSVNFTEGDDVQQGQLLFTIDRRPFDVALRQAQAALGKDGAQAENAKAQLTRADDLLKRGLMTRADYDTALATSRSLDEALNVDQAQIDSAKLNLQYTQIGAPISGRTGALLVHQGSLLRTTDVSPLVIINQITPIRVTFAVPASLLPRVREGQAQAALAVEARPSGQGAPQNGTVSFIDNAVDPATATIKIKALFPNSDRRLWPGDFVEVRLRLSIEPHAIVVPSAAVQNGQQGQYIYVVGSDRTVTARPVKVARIDGDDSVIAEGLTAGEEVVTDGQLRLVPGSKVKPQAGGR